MEGNNFSDLGITKQPSGGLGGNSVTGSTWVNKWHLKLAIIFYSLSLIAAILFLALSFFFLVEVIMLFIGLFTLGHGAGTYVPDGADVRVIAYGLSAMALGVFSVGIFGASIWSLTVAIKARIQKYRYSVLSVVLSILAILNSGFIIFITFLRNVIA